MTRPSAAPRPGAPVFAVGDLSVVYGEHRALDHVTTTIPAGTITAIIGPNGCGKSTLLRSLAGLVPFASGSVELEGHDIRTIPSRRYARDVALLPQGPTAPDGLTVADLVARGRDPHRRWYDQWSARDEQLVDETLARTGLASLADRPLDSLSGGQRQRAWIALTLAQRTRVLLLDEPTTFLDVAHQLEVLAMVERLHRESGVTVVMVLHELSMAARYADNLVAMRGGRIVAAGTPDAVITEEVLGEVFGIEAEILHDRLRRRPVVVPTAVRHEQDRQGEA